MEELLDNITKLKNLPKNSDYKNLSTNRKHTFKFIRLQF